MAKSDPFPACYYARRTAKIGAMRAFWLSWAVFLGSIAGLSAQISVEVVLEQDQFLRDESLPIKIRITNLSGQPVQLAQDADWLNFHVEYQEGRSVSRTGQVPANEPYTLQSAKTVTRQFNLMPYFDFTRVGRYAVSATVRIKNWDEEFSSAPKAFEISSGFRLWEQEFGVPGTNAPPEMRKYTLLQANYLSRLMLYLRVADTTDNQVYRVFPIGPLVSFSRPEAQLDKDSNLHVLSQVGPWSFIYMVVNPQGIVQTRSRYDYTDTRPVLRPREGKVIVSGGIRRITPEDVPPVPLEPSAASTNDTTVPKP
jgi:hypothetical protein